MTEERNDPSDPTATPDVSTRIYEGVPDLGRTNDIAAIEREQAVRGRGRENVEERLEDESA